MEKELKFKKEWFDVLNRCDRNLRIDVIEAVFQYFFTGAEPEFSDDARTIAFGFIRADIDATRRRRERRLARKNKPQEAAEPTVVRTDKASAKPDKTAEAARVSPPNIDEREKLYGLVLQWNAMVKNTSLEPVDATLHIDSEEYHPALRAMRRLPYHKVFAAVKGVRTDPAKPTFAEFFNGLNG